MLITRSQNRHTHIKDELSKWTLSNQQVKRLDVIFLLYKNTYMPFAETNPKHVSLASLFVFDWLNSIPVPRVLRNKTELQTDCPFFKHIGTAYKHTRLPSYIWMHQPSQHTYADSNRRARYVCPRRENRLLKRAPFGSGIWRPEIVAFSVRILYSYTMQRAGVKLYIGKLYKEKRW